MARKSILFTALILVCILASACSPHQTKLTEADLGKTVEINVGEQIVIQLEGNPTTGYTWEASDLDGSLLQQVGDPQFKSSSPGLVGAGGTVILTFKAIKAGSTVLNLAYHRPWEKDVAPIKMFTVNVTVK
jgi:inhibitor of cysteine peptidase